MSAESRTPTALRFCSACEKQQRLWESLYRAPSEVISPNGTRHFILSGDTQRTLCGRAIPREWL